MSRIVRAGGEMFKGLVLKKQADLFSVEIESGQILDCVARKILKKDGIFVGDFVWLDEENAICRVEERKNLLIRPPVANIDKMFVVVSPVPKADLYTVDKLLLFCALNSIEPVICINKKDIDEGYCKEIAEIYRNIAEVLTFSTLDDSVLSLEKHIKGICVMAGQSAVGKSSILNALKKDSVAKVDTFSKKIERGKQTTRTVQLYKFGKENFLADTAGFSKLDESLLELEEAEIKSYYPDFLSFAGECKYKSCIHTAEKDCGVFKAVQEGKIQKERYKNYLKLCDAVKKIKRH